MALAVTIIKSECHSYLSQNTNVSNTYYLKALPNSHMHIRINMLQILVFGNRIKH